MLTSVAQKPTDEKNEAIQDELAGYVRQRFWYAKNARAGLEQELMHCLRQRASLYEPDEEKDLGSIKTFYPLTALKCRALEAWIADIYNGAQDSPYTIEPTPKPQVPEYVRTLVKEQIKKELLMMGADPSFDIRERMEELVEITEGLILEYAKKAAARMQLSIQDTLTEIQFFARVVLKEFLPDFSTYPYAVLKGPYIEHVQELSWGTGYKPIVTLKPKYVVTRVSPFDYFWSPNAIKAGDDYEFELLRVFTGDLAKYKGLESYIDVNIDKVIALYGPSGYREETVNYYERHRIESGVTNQLQRENLLDTLNFWGKVPGSILKEYGLDVKDVAQSYAVNVWTIANIPIRVRFNPHPLGKSIFKVTAYERIPGSIPGRSVPMLIRPNQQTINSAVRALRRNMGIGSGPFVEVDNSRVDLNDVPDEIMPHMVKLVQPDLTGGGRDAYKFHNIDNHVPELQTIIDAETRRADETSGIPAYSYGNNAAAGAARTVGGLAILMGNAAKGIQNAIANIDMDIISPIVQDLFIYKMQYEDDPSIKCDAQVVIKGLRGVIVRDAAVQKRLEALNVLTPFTQMPDETGKPLVAPEGIKFMLREILKGLELPVDSIIPDPAKQKILQNIVNQQAPAPQIPGMPIAQDQAAQVMGQVPPEILQQAGVPPASLGQQQIPPNLPIQMTGRNI